MNADKDIYKEEERGGDKTGGRETGIVIIVIIIILKKTFRSCKTFKMPNKQRNRDKNKTKKFQPDPEVDITKLTIDLAQEIMDQIETDKNIKITYICDGPPLIRIRRKERKTSNQ